MPKKLASISLDVAGKVIVPVETSNLDTSKKDKIGDEVIYIPKSFQFAYLILVREGKFIISIRQTFSRVGKETVFNITFRSLKDRFYQYIQIFETFLPFYYGRMD